MSINLSDFGFLVDENGIPDQVRDGVIKVSCAIQDVLGFDQKLVGMGAMIKVAEVDGVDLDLMRNLVEISVKTPFSVPSFIFRWATALHNYNMFKSYNQACDSLFTQSVSKEDAHKRLLARWQSAELGLHHALLSIFDGAEDVKISREAVAGFNKRIDTGSFLTAEATSFAIRALQDDAESSGCELNGETASLIALMVNMRAEAAMRLQNMSASKETRYIVPVAYASRMTDLAEETGVDDILSIYPVVAIASMIAKKLGVTLHADDDRVLPTLDEMKEMGERLPAFLNAIKNDEFKPEDAGKVIRSSESSLAARRPR